MNCPNCGAPLKDGARFCSKCGCRMDSGGPAQGKPMNKRPPAPVPAPQSPVPGPQGNPGPPPGYPYQPPAGYMQGPGYPAEPGTEPPKKKRKLWPVFLILGLLLAGGVCGAAGFLYYRDKQGEEALLESIRQEFKDDDEEPEETLKPEEEGEEETLPEETGEEKGGEESSAHAETEAALSDSPAARTIAQYNTGDSTAGIDVYAENYEPAAKNYSLAWNKDLFYTLEDISPTSSTDGLINGYDIARKMLKNSATGNLMEYEIYTSPSTGKVNKIVSIEYIDDYLEITDYYYDDAGKVSFIFVREDINYIPSYAVPTRDGQRFYFQSDCMVKWRVVSNGIQSNYVIGPESARQGDNPADSIFQYGTLEAGAKANYDQTEKRMLNAAYNTYQTVLTAEGISEITGYVYDEQGRPLPGAKVVLASDETGEALFSAQADGSGMYRIMVPSDDKKYRLEVSKEGCVSATVYGIHINGQVLSDYQDSVYMVPQDENRYPVNVHMYDALNYAQDGSGMERLGNAAIYIRDGVNHREGGVVAQATADAAGAVSLSLPPGMYTAEVVKDGYDSTYYNFAARPDMEDVQINASPRLAEGEVRVVLTWGYTPQDLDSHLFTPYDNAFGDATYHIWYGNKHDQVGNNLDVDDTDGYGPETMTIPALRNGLYKYYVADYTNCSRNNPASFEMSDSGAMVNVYTSNGLTATFMVPANTAGAIWEVFEIRNGSIVPIQRYYSNIEDKSWWHNDK